MLTENRSFTALRALRYFSGKTPTQGSFTPILLFQTSNISKTIQNTRFYFLEYHQIHLIIGRFQIFSPIPVPVPDKYCFNIISVNLVYPVFKLILLRIYFIFTFCFVSLNLNILLGNYPFYGDKTKDLENLKQGDFVKIF